MWSSSIVSFGKTYKFRMVGKSPLVTQTTPTTKVTTDVIPIKFTFSDGTVLDPTTVDPTCSPAGSADSLVLNSPVFKTHAYTVGGTNVGTVQYLDRFQRENFAKQILNAGAINPGYHVTLAPVNHNVISLSVGSSAGQTVAAPCGRLGLLDINAWDSYVQGTLLPQLSSSVTPTHFPMFLFYNVVMYVGGNPNNCCVLGYHSAFARSSFGGAIQTYGTSDYDTSGAFSGTGDVSVLTHEVGEWMDDPFGTNPTPAWGHIGQVGGCQSNLEVGDPLSGTIHTVTMSNGFTYHVQELAFFSWFYRQSPSIGLNGWYSSDGTFTSAQSTICA